MAEFELPFIKLWVGDFIADTHHWTAEEVGHYFRLLLHQWRNGEIPPDPIRRELVSPGMAGSWSVLEPKFPKAGDGRLQNRRLERERESAIMEKIKRSRQTEAARRARHPNSVTESVTENVTEDVTSLPLIVHSSESIVQSKRTKTLVDPSGDGADVKGGKKRTSSKQIEAAFETFLRCREIHYVEKHGKKPGGKLDLTPKRRQLIATAIRAHGYEKAKAAAAGIFLSEFHAGDNESKLEYLTPEHCWRMNAKSDNVERFSELAEQLHWNEPEVKA